MIEAFLTAYDPSDLPGTSIDPLGFDRGYNYLADTILPGLTNVAAHPRYFGLLCAGIQLASDACMLGPQEQLQKRQECVLRLERFWALANVFSRPENSNSVRGVTYAQARVKEIVDAGTVRTTADYPLLLRQAQYGVIGIYGNVADGMRFLNRSEMALTPALGEVAADAFILETEMPPSLQRAVKDNGEISVATLKSWGERAHVDARTQPKEARCISEALHADPVRSRMARWLTRTKFAGNESELDRLARIVLKLNGTAANRDLLQAINCILSFEDCYRLVSLAFERLLWLSRYHAGAVTPLKELRTDSVLKSVISALPGSVSQFRRAVAEASEGELKLSAEKLNDVSRFLEESNIAKTTEEMVRAIISRHTDVQHGKFDKGRRKMPWLEINGTNVSLTITRVGGMDSEAVSPEHIGAHPYRLAAADAFISAAAEETAN